MELQILQSWLLELVLDWIGVWCVQTEDFMDISGDSVMVLH